MMDLVNKVVDYLANMDPVEFADLTDEAQASGFDIHLLSIWPMQDLDVAFADWDIADIMRTTIRYELDPDYAYIYHDADTGAWGYFDDLTDDTLIYYTIVDLAGYIVENDVDLFDNEIRRILDEGDN